MHPDFPEVPVGIPLTYTLTMHACLSAAPAERPNFEQVRYCIQLQPQHTPSASGLFMWRIFKDCSTPLVYVLLRTVHVAWWQGAI